MLPFCLLETLKISMMLFTSRLAQYYWLSFYLNRLSNLAMEDLVAGLLLGD